MNSPQNKKHDIFSVIKTEKGHHQSFEGTSRLDLLDIGNFETIQDNKLIDLDGIRT